MATRFDLYRRLEPAEPFTDLDRGFAAEVADPVWFLARQWQLGEHRADDASSPVGVSYSVSHQPLEPLDGNPLLDPRQTPPEALIETEPDDWWTPGRRVAIGLRAASALPALTDANPDLLLQNLPRPYEQLNGKAYDGRKLFFSRAALGLNAALFAEVPNPTSVDHWDPVELVYSARFVCGGRTLAVARHDGGDVDWYSADADAPLPVPAVLPDPSPIIPTRVRYPGAPHPRWWQIEDANTDIGGFPPDRSHFTTLLLIDLIAGHSDDWFTFPIPAATGSVVTLHRVEILDAFDDRWQVEPPSDWSLFAVRGLADTSLVVWPTVATPLAGPPLEEVLFGVDEDANLMWAVERRLLGQEVPTPEILPRPSVDGQVLASVRSRYEYEAAEGVVPNWHPYSIATIDNHRRFVQGRLANLNVMPPEPLPEPLAAVLTPANTPPGGPAHQIEPATIAPTGLRLERRPMLTRRTDGTPVFWIQRRRQTLLVPPALRLRHDVFRPVTTVAPE